MRPPTPPRFTRPDGSVQPSSGPTFRKWKKARAKNPKLKTHLTKQYRDYLRSPEWAAKRKLVLERDEHRCRSCGSNKRLQAHHITYARLCDELLTDLITLCEDCHETTHLAKERRGKK